MKVTIAVKIKFPAHQSFLEKKSLSYLHLHSSSMAYVTPWYYDTTEACVTFIIPVL